MGSPKISLELPGAGTMGERAATLLALVCADVVVAGGENLPPPGLARLPRIPDRRRGCGPLAGIEALLATDRDTAYLVLPCDLPLVLPSLLFSLARAAEGKDAAVFRLPHADRIEPFPLCIAAAAFPRLTARLAEGRFETIPFLESLAPEVVTVPRRLAICFRNVNEPGDLEDAAFRENLFSLR